MRTFSLKVANANEDIPIRKHETIAIEPLRALRISIEKPVQTVR